MLPKPLILSALLTSLLLVGVSCSSVPTAAGPSEAATAEKTFIPHKSWNCGMPEGIPKPENGTLVFETELKLDQAYDVGKTQFGQRQALVIQGGPITSPKFQGTVLPGGLDFQLTLANGTMEIEQILVIRGSDGKFVYARYAGTGPNADDVRMVFDFEPANGSASASLATGKYVGRRIVNLTAKTMTLRVYDVSAVIIPTDATNVLKITRPADAPEQSWDFRKVDRSERQGEQIITENVTLGGSQSVGATKRGNRNIIPITGGRLSGKIEGKVLPGGADYQNLANPMSIDARYLWQTNDGEIIIVRNAGPFGALAPTFEAKVDGKYAWLNSGKYLSSNPGMGAGGVGLTFYKSN
jgi:hypothetical protein